MSSFIPVIDLTYEGSIKIVRAKETPIITVRLKDLLCEKSLLPNLTFNKIMEAGGLHPFLNYDGIIILSLIIKDEWIKLHNAKRYSFYINSLKPDYYITPDRPTYFKQRKKSQEQIAICLNETIELLKLCKTAKPLGLVKGCNLYQIDAHSSMLKSLGINDFVLHAGDFRREGSQFYSEMAKDFAWLLRKKARLLFLYGFGSQKQLLSHSFADAFISYNHFVAAYKGLYYDGVNLIKAPSNINFERIMLHNYFQMHKNMTSLKNQTKLTEANLTKWEAEKAEHQLEEEAMVAQVPVMAL